MVSISIRASASRSLIDRAWCFLSFRVKQVPASFLVSFGHNDGARGTMRGVVNAGSGVGATMRRAVCTR